MKTNLWPDDSKTEGAAFKCRLLRPLLARDLIIPAQTEGRARASQCVYDMTVCDFPGYGRVILFNIHLLELIEFL